MVVKKSLILSYTCYVGWVASAAAWAVQARGALGYLT